MGIAIHFNLLYSRASKLRPENTFVNIEKLIDKKLFDLVECNISRNNPIA